MQLELQMNHNKWRLYSPDLHPHSGLFCLLFLKQNDLIENKQQVHWGEPRVSGPCFQTCWHQSEDCLQLTHLWRGKRTVSPLVFLEIEPPALQIQGMHLPTRCGCPVCFMLFLFFIVLFLALISATGDLCLLCAPLLHFYLGGHSFRGAVAEELGSNSRSSIST